MARKQYIPYLAINEFEGIEEGTTFRFNGLINDYGVTAGRMWTTQTNPAKLHRFRDRVLVGASAEYNGEIMGDTGVGSWLADHTYWGIPVTHATLEQNSVMSVVSDQGYGAFVAATRNSDSPTVFAGCTAVVGIGFNDRNDPTQKSTVFPGYFVGILHEDAEALTSRVHGIEVNVWNQKGDDYAREIRPYAMFPNFGSSILWLGSGWKETDRVSYMTSCAIGILNSSLDTTAGKFRSGIVFKAESLYGCDGETGTGQAIAMARGHRLDWYAPETGGVATAALGVSLFSAVDDSENGIKQIFEDEQISFYSMNDKLQLRVKVFNDGVNAFRLAGSATGNPLDISAQGDDADISIRILPKNSTVKLGGTTGPTGDDLFSCGQLAYRWSDIYSANGAIVTSDANQKQDFLQLDDKECRVAMKIKSMVKKFRFKKAVGKKGNDARIHTGICAQDIASAFRSEGLDPYKYAMFCAEEVDGKETYGIRYNELLTFVIGAM